MLRRKEHELDMQTGLRMCSLSLFIVCVSPPFFLCRLLDTTKKETCRILAWLVASFEWGSGRRSRGRRLRTWLVCLPIGVFLLLRPTLPTPFPRLLFPQGRTLQESVPSRGRGGARGCGARTTRRGGRPSA